MIAPISDSPILGFDFLKCNGGNINQFDDVITSHSDSFGSIPKGEINRLGKGRKVCGPYTVYHVNITHTKECARQITAFDVQFNYCTLITSGSVLTYQAVCRGMQTTLLLGRVVLLH